MIQRDTTWRKIVLAAVALTFVEPSRVSAQHETFARMADVALTLSVDSASYAAGEVAAERMELDGMGAPLPHGEIQASVGVIIRSARDRRRPLL